MSLHLNFEPHSWYKGFAIKKEEAPTGEHIGRRGHSIAGSRRLNTTWRAFTDDGNTYQIVELHSSTLKQLKIYITEYRQREAERMARMYSEVNNV